MRDKKNRETIRRILLSIRQYKWKVGCSLILALVIVALTLYVPILIGQAVDLIMSRTGGICRTGKNPDKNWGSCGGNRPGPVADEPYQQPDYLPGSYGYPYPGI